MGFTPANATWQNNVSEVQCTREVNRKRALKFCIGENVLTLSEIQTVCYEAANLLNERRINRHPWMPEDDTYLCPNDLFLGRSTSRVPSGPIQHVQGNERPTTIWAHTRNNQSVLEEVDYRLLSQPNSKAKVVHLKTKRTGRRYCPGPVVRKRVSATKIKLLTRDWVYLRKD